MHILVCSPSWPTNKTIDFVFVEQLCCAFADLGHRVTVIAPQSITKCIMRHVPIAKRHYIYQTGHGSSIEIFRPYTLTMGNLGIKMQFGTYKQAVRRAFRRVKERPDVCYGHFWECIFTLYSLAKEMGVPLCGASGEEEVSKYIHHSDDFISEVRNYLSGIVCVSTKNQQECITLNLIDTQKSIVVPNAIDHTLFRKMDKAVCRRNKGLENDDYVVAFVGQFTQRKGTLRLNNALKQINDNSIKALFIGNGIETPDYKGILFQGSVPHEKLPEYLNCADVFVLPTENEGCSNAIIEAMACGLPIISTDATFNYDILNESNSILVDCHNIKQIEDAIIRLKEDRELRVRMSDAALEKASTLTLSKRAERIVEFIKERAL